MTWGDNIHDDRVWEKIVNILRKEKHNIPVNLPRHLEDVVDSKVRLSSELAKLVESIRKQEKMINIAKTGGTVYNVVGTGLLFSPFALVGEAMLLAGGIVLAGTSISDWIINYVKSSNLEELLKEDNKKAQKLVDDFEKIDVLAKEVLSHRIVSNMEEAKTLTLVVILKLTMDGVKTLSAGLTSYALKKIVLGGITDPNLQLLGSVSVSMLGICTSALCILDCILSWLTKNPNREKAEKAKEKVDECIPHLKEMRKVIKDIVGSKKGA